MLNRLNGVEVVLKAVHRLKLEWVHVERVPVPDSTREVAIWVSCAVALSLLDMDVLFLRGTIRADVGSSVYVCSARWRAERL